MKKLVTAIIGMGVVGKRRKHFIEKNKNYELIAVSDITFKKDSKKNDIYYYKDYKSIKNHKLDCVFVTLPNYLAPVVTGEFLKKNISVFCEKPPGRNINDIKKIIKIENKSKGKLMYGFNHRYHGSVEMAKRIIQKKMLGEVLNIRGLYGKSKIVTYDKGEWRSKKKFAGGGILLDQGIHMLDIINYFCGPFGNFKSFVSNRYWKYDIEDDVFAIFKSPKGVIASIHSTAIQWEHKFRIEISLQKGSIELNGILSGTKSYGSESLTIVKVKNNKFKNKITKKIIYFKKDNSWKKEIEEFSRILINSNKNDIFKGTSKEALEVMNMIDSIYKNDKKIN